MPITSRITKPGALHHIIARGIERTKIFQDDTEDVRFHDICKLAEKLGFVFKGGKGVIGFTDILG